MRAFNAESNTRDNTGEGELHKSNGACLGSSRSSKWFKYDFEKSYVKPIKGLSIDETIAYTMELVQSFMSEFKIEGLNFSYEGSSFIFSYKDKELDVTKSHELYSCVIISRWMSSGIDAYDRILNNIYELRQKGYTVFESYLIAASAGDYPGYSFTPGGIFDLENYRNLPDRRILMRATDNRGNVTQTFNNRILEELGGQMVDGNLSTGVANKVDDIEKYYFEKLEEAKKFTKMFIRYNSQFIDEFKGYVSNRDWTDVENSHKVNLSGYIERSREVKFLDDIPHLRIKLLPVYKALHDNRSITAKEVLYVNTGQVNLPIWDYNKKLLTLMSAQEYLQEIKEQIEECVNAKGTSLLKTASTKKLMNTFFVKGMDLVDEINKSKILEKELKKWD